MQELNELMEKMCNCQKQSIDLETKLVIFEWMMEISDNKKTPIGNERINSLLRANLYNQIAQKLIKKYETHE